MTKTKKAAPEGRLARDLAELLALVRKAEGVADRLAEAPAGDLAAMYDRAPEREEDADEGTQAGWLLEDLRGTAYNLGRTVATLEGVAPVAACELAARLRVEVAEGDAA